MNENKEELQQILQDFEKDPAMRDFKPAVQRMLDSLDNPEDDIAETLDVVFDCLYSHHCHQLAKGAYINGAMSVPRKKWYED